MSQDLRVYFAPTSLSESDNGELARLLRSLRNLRFSLARCRLKKHYLFEEIQDPENPLTCPKTIDGSLSLLLNEGNAVLKFRASTPNAELRDLEFAIGGAHSSSQNQSIGFFGISGQTPTNKFRTELIRLGFRWVDCLVILTKFFAAGSFGVRVDWEELHRLRHGNAISGHNNPVGNDFFQLGEFYNLHERSVEVALKHKPFHPIATSIGTVFGTHASVAPDALEVDSK